MLFQVRDKHEIKGANGKKNENFEEDQGQINEGGKKKVLPCLCHVEERFNGNKQSVNNGF